MKYEFNRIDKKWQDRWEQERAFCAEDHSEKPKFYGLVEFPYPSGAGMHVGHIKAYSGLEVVSRKRRMQGYNVMFPIGFDGEIEIKENLAIAPHHHEGLNSNWVLVDYTGVVVNIFQEEARELYALERLWGDGTKIDISNLIVKED